MGLAQLSEGENKFFESGGTDNAALHAENPTIAPKHVPQETPNKELEQPQLNIEPVEETPEQKQAKEAKAAEEAAKSEREKKRKEAIEGLGLVPLEALQEARNEGKLTKRELDTLKARLAEIEPLLAQLPKPQAKAQEANPYDPQAQPAEHKAYQEWIEQKQTLKETADKVKRFEDAQLYQSNIQRASAWAGAQEAEYKKTQPAYDDAYKFAVEARSKELAAMGIPPEQVQQTIYQDQIQIVSMAMQTGKNPAEIIWNLAQARGFNPENKGNGVDKTAAVTAQIKAGQKAAGGLNSGGATPKGELTIEDINRMPTKTVKQRDEYNKAWDKYWATH